MSVAWGDASLLVELLDSQFEYLLSLNGSVQLLQTRRLLAFLRRDSRTAALLQDFRCEALRAKALFAKADQRMRRRLAALWREHSTEVHDALASAASKLRPPYDDLSDYEHALKRKVAVTLPKATDTEREEQAKLLLLKLKVWFDRVPVADEYANREHPTPHPALAQITVFERDWAHASRELQTAGSLSPWAAYRRLATHARRHNPVPPDPADAVAVIQYTEDCRKAEAVRDADDVAVGEDDDFSIKRLYRGIAADARLLHHELRHRIGLGRSRLAVVERYAARCASFDADELRARSAARRGAPERELTLHFARYLFDQGLNPLLDPTISGLRPDIMHLGAGEPLYVEAKQYTSSPERTLRRAYDQIWSTWLSLRQHNPSVTEAFLVVFRRAGALVHLPETIRHEGLKLHSVLVDISANRGSRETERGIHLTTADLLPTPAKSSRAHASARTT